ncbi:hypothetical protein RB213_004463 [Colletotrichum asianum]
MAVPPASPPPPGNVPNQRHPWDEPQVPDDRFSRAWVSAKRPRQLRYWTDSPAAIAPSGLANFYSQIEAATMGNESTMMNAEPDAVM